MSQPIPRPDPQTTARLMDDVCSVTGVPVKESYAFGELVELVKRAEYDLPADLILHLVDLGRIPAPDGGEWTPEHIHWLLAYAEGHRLWTVGSRLHNHKLTRARSDREALAGRPFPVVAQHGLLGWLLMLTQAEHRELREACFEAVLMKLAELDVTDLHS